ncbi:Stk1 family PASTA domain-containing Ser/Thr kinase [Rubrobacter marinus]|uniref:non-specific serine/threonine protein kinase n=1 Tax=Rubrobacter marinus TaxID=2653852 RepID=A0A6G8PRX7_9ACTN|nr:Stk1 family PASTA domain-containing Ser/Thr kinase [Rubrobacter marinus]QIN77180.1 Stk1 family PASTA domain-containing Ser/Thr kinase [Rubrobacter marinus]
MEQLVDNRYRISKPLGSGGMAEVYLAHDDVLDRDVALKVMSGRYADDEEFVERFKREAQSAAALSHPNIVSIYDRGEDERGTYYIAMEYLPGGTLKDRILERGALPPRTAAAVALQIAEALQAAHAKGVVHRDIKPHNVLVTGSGDVKVGDFGIARAASSSTMTKTGSILGTAHYISPEQAMGEPVGPQSDLYSLGIVLYEMLTGTLPYDAETPIGIAMKHVNGYLAPPKALNPAVPDGINSVTCRLLAKSPDDRYADAGELIEDLERVLEGLSPSNDTTRMMTARRRDGTAQRTAVMVPPAREDYGRPRRRRWVVPVLLLLLLLAAIGGIAYSQVGGGDPQSLPVPNLEDARSIDEAVTVAGGDFEVAPGRRVESTEPVGAVVSQDPAPQEQAVPGSTITVDTSGTQVADLPDVEGRTEEEARGILDEAGFGVEVEERESSTEDDGRVLSQDPAGGEGETAEVGSAVTIAVGSGPADAEVPELGGQTPEQAEEILEDAGLELGDEAEAPNESVPAGQIVDQQPSPGTDLRRGSSVDVTVSTGPEPPDLVPIPDVSGQTADAAAATLYNALFFSNVVEVESNLPAGTVVSTSPAAGTPADPYAITVTVNVSSGPPPAPVEAPTPSPQPEPEPEPDPQPSTPTQQNGGGGNGGNAQTGDGGGNGGNNGNGANNRNNNNGGNNNNNNNNSNNDD